MSTASTGPVIEWRQLSGEAFEARFCADFVALINGNVLPGASVRWQFRFGMQGIDKGESETLDAARTACEAAIRDWFAKAGWPQSLSPQAEGGEDAAEAVAIAIYEATPANYVSQRGGGGTKLRQTWATLCRTFPEAADNWRRVARAALTASRSQGDSGYAAGLEAAAKVAESLKPGFCNHRDAKWHAQEIAAAIRSLSTEAGGATELAEGQRSGQAGTGRKPSRSPAGRDCVAGPEVDRGGLRQDSPAPPAQEEEASAWDAIHQRLTAIIDSQLALKSEIAPLLAENAMLRFERDEAKENMLAAARTETKCRDWLAAERDTQRAARDRAEATVSRLRSALEPFIRSIYDHEAFKAEILKGKDWARLIECFRDGRDALAALASKEPHG